ncbi:DUF4097 family beta strand repeat-containing protein [Paenibacillus contaminans]|uniref:DUF4097 domain-containing protein n=1 Tax=Paenibacillus contaminans TaxID=450362 RepID=A0A329MCR3_9BACL|nr:DUF4097 family beta strand repeat-containing protein [Paenibacillus contaminans]RAV17650.1 hypothetical protein DQG23_26320 [Paenibacillus contaminans]
MLKVGRYTAAALMVLVGALLLIDQSTGSSYLAKAVEWWPAVLIALGVEYMLFSFIYHKGERQLKLDLGGVMIAVIIAAIVVGTTQAGKISFDWFNVVSGNGGQKFEKEATTVPLASGTEQIELDNTNGPIYIKSGAVTGILIEATVYVDMSDTAEAEKIADLSKIEYKEGSKLHIEAKGEPYSGKLGIRRTPRMDLVVTVPETSGYDFDFETRNGKIEVDRIAAKSRLKLQTTNGSLTLTDINGNTEARTTNGSINAANIKGDAELKTTNGSVDISQVEGKVKVESTNGKIILDQAGREVIAITSNGKIEARSNTIGGDWELRTTNSKVETELPSTGNFTVDGATTNSSVDTDLPLSKDKNSIEGKIGTGEHKVLIRSSNGHISVNKSD